MYKMPEFGVVLFALVKKYQNIVLLNFARKFWFSKQVNKAHSRDPFGKAAISYLSASFLKKVAKSFSIR